MEEGVGQNIDTQGQVLTQDLDKETGALAARGGVVRATNGINRPGDLLRAAPRRPLEEHVLDEVGDAGHIGSLIPRSNLHPHTNRDRLDGRHPLAEDDHPAWQHLAVVRETGHYSGGPLLSFELPLRFQRLFSTQPDLPTLVDVDYLHHDLFPVRQDVFDLHHPLSGNLRDM